MPTQNNQISIEEIKELWDKATSGPWGVDEKYPCVFQVRHDLVIARMEPASMFPGHFIERDANMQFIAALPDIADRAISEHAENQRLRAAIERALNELQGYTGLSLEALNGLKEVLG